ncbi:hypothetical protein [Aneurinibacillus tyrosinisolvens]|uniref:hypothetical protein n=1 Tax=Aneurinibacillus tyrosinisolvens TaxID=1443435 RepID=UPI00063F9E12|nr:hypothetical protein [Aneurinibacillus tyrosinisolvens]
MKAKIIPFFISAVMVISPVTTFAKGFSGGASGSHSSYHSQTHSTTSNNHNGSTYHSGYKSSSTNVTNQPRHNSIPAAAPNKTRSILSHAAAFGGGALLGGMLGSMFHPFGGGQPAGFGSQLGSSFSLLGFLLDILVIVLIIWAVRKLFFNKRNA